MKTFKNIIYSKYKILTFATNVYIDFRTSKLFQCSPVKRVFNIFIILIKFGSIFK